MTATTSLPRQRRGRSPTPRVVNNSTNPDDENTEFLDSDDQRALIATLRAEAQTHQRQLQRAFVVLGGTGSFLSLIFPWLCPEECSTQPMRCWIHAFLAIPLHVSSIALVWKNTQTDRLLQPSYKFGFLEISSLLAHLWCLLLCVMVGLGHDSAAMWLGSPSSTPKHDTEIDWFHVGLCAGNLVTYLGAWLLQWDARSTSQALQELQQAQYDHKTL